MSAPAERRTSILRVSGLGGSGLQRTLLTPKRKLLTLRRVYLFSCQILKRREKVIDPASVEVRWGLRNRFSARENALSVMQCTDTAEGKRGVWGHVSSRWKVKYA